MPAEKQREEERGGVGVGGKEGEGAREDVESGGEEEERKRSVERNGRNEGEDREREEEWMREEWREHKDMSGTRRRSCVTQCRPHYRVSQADGGSGLSTARPTPVCSLHLKVESTCAGASDSEGSTVFSRRLPAAFSRSDNTQVVGDRRAPEHTGPSETSGSVSLSQGHVSCLETL